MPSRQDGRNKNMKHENEKKVRELKQKYYQQIEDAVETYRDIMSYDENTDIDPLYLLNNELLENL